MSDILKRNSYKYSYTVSGLQFSARAKIKLKQTVCPDLVVLLLVEEQYEVKCEICLSLTNICISNVFSETPRDFK